MEALTKENFWNDLQLQFPEAMKVFCNWIDEYKQKNKWDQLFLNYGASHNVKFHDLPYAMIIGIWMQFENEMSATHRPFYFYKARKHIKDFIQDLNAEATD